MSFKWSVVLFSSAPQCILRYSQELVECTLASQYHLPGASTHTHTLPLYNRHRRDINENKKNPQHLNILLKSFSHYPSFTFPQQWRSPQSNLSHCNPSILCVHFPSIPG